MLLSANRFSVINIISMMCAYHLLSWPLWLIHTHHIIELSSYWLVSRNNGKCTTTRNISDCMMSTLSPQLKAVVVLHCHLFFRLKPRHWHPCSCPHPPTTVMSLDIHAASVLRQHLPSPVSHAISISNTACHILPHRFITSTLNCF